MVPTISFRLLYGLLILRHDRRLLWLEATAHPTAEWTRYFRPRPKARPGRWKSSIRLSLRVIPSLSRLFVQQRSCRHPKTDGIFLPADDRRHYVAWSNAQKDEFSDE